MILAAGLSPAWQQVMVFDAVQAGEVNRAAEVHWCASGKVLNVGRALAALGAPQQTLSLTGGAAGAAIEREFVADGIAARWIRTQAATRICTTLLERSPRRVTELVENARPISPAELANFREAMLAAAATARAAVLTGSLPSGTPPTLYRDVIQRIDGPVIVDARGLELLHALEAHPLVVKPNRAELEFTVGHSIANDSDLIAAMQGIVQRGAAWALVSQGSAPAWLASADAVYRIVPPEIEVINPIGSGDCLAAGLACGVYEGREVPDAARLGMAAAMENARQLLPARLDRRRVEQLADQLLLERVV